MRRGNGQPVKLNATIFSALPLCFALVPVLLFFPQIAGKL